MAHRSSTLELELTDAQYDRLTQVSAPSLGVPHETAAAAAAPVRRHPVPVI